jgi:uncharacterized protein (TIRG00374 family)
MKKKLTYAGNIVFMILILIFTFYTLLKGQNIKKILQLLQGARWTFFLIAMAVSILFLVLQSVSMQVILQSLQMPARFLSNMKYAFIGFLFNAITPSAGGGQPMQVIYMHQDGISVGAASVSLLFWTIIYKVALLVIEAFIFIFYHSFALHYLGGYLWLFLVGIFVNVVSIFLYSLIVFSKNGAKNIAHFGAFICHKLRIIKKKEKWLAKIDHTISYYQEGAVYIRTHLETGAIVLLITILQRLCAFSITWFVCLALNADVLSMLKILMLQSFVSVCIDILPFPGGVGANEGFFVTLFRQVMGGQTAISAMLLSRGASFYGLLVISVVVMMVAQTKSLQRQVKKANASKKIHKKKVHKTKPSR